MGVIRLFAEEYSIAANEKDYKILELEPERGKKYRILEINLQADAKLKFKIFISNIRIGECVSTALAKDTRRRLVNWEIENGKPLIIYVDELSGSSNKAYVEIIYEEVTS